MEKLSDYVVVIIGGSSGIGKESAKLLAGLGAQIIIIARGENRLAQAAEEIALHGERVEVIKADVSSPKDIQAAADRIKQKFGKLDALIYSAADFYLSPVETMDIHLAKNSMEINYWGALYATQTFLPLIRLGEGKTMLFISSLSAYCTPPFFTAYAATKHALRGFLLSLRQELRTEGIHIGMVSPGPVQTPLIEADLHKDMYKLPPGIPVMQPEIAAKRVVQAILKKNRDMIVPRRLTIAAYLGNTFPILLEAYYRFTIRGWKKSY